MSKIQFQSQEQYDLSKKVTISPVPKTSGIGVPVGSISKIVPSETTEDLGLSDVHVEQLQQYEIQQLIDEGILSTGTTIDDISKLDIDRRSKVLMAAKIHRVDRSLPKAEIESLSFTVLSSDIIKSIAHVDITDDDIRTPGKPGSINDPKLGISSGVEFCGTCKRRFLGCPGHLGKIKLESKIYNPNYVRDIISILSSICYCCSQLIISPEVLDMDYGINMSTPAEIRLKRISEICIQLTSGRYTHPPYSQKMDEDAKLVAEELAKEGKTIGKTVKCISNHLYIINITQSSYKKTGRIEYVDPDDEAPSKSKEAGKKKQAPREMEPEEAYRILKEFEKYPEQVALLGLGNTKPSDLIMEYVLVLPPLKRGASLIETEYETDSLGFKYSTIIKSNKEVYNARRTEMGIGGLQKKSRTGSSVSEARTNLFKAVASLFKSDADPAAYSAAKQTSIIDEITGKQGVYRGELMASRVDFSARAVIGPNPALEYGQVGIPQSWAKYLTVRETVANYNIKYLTNLIRVGKVTNIIKRDTEIDGYTQEINDSNKDTINVEIGDVLFRHLQDDDWVTVNRQPTLHRPSFIALRAKLMDALTVTLHLSYTTGYNADFDGDEMNEHVAQTIEAIAELATLMKAEACIANEQNSSPIVGLVMDNILAAYLLTHENEIMDMGTWNNIIIKIKTRDDLGTLDRRLIENGVALRSGRALFSALLPAGFYYNKGGVVIKDGIMTSGVIKKDHIGPSPNSIIQELYMDHRFGIPRTSAFLTDAPWVLNQWLLYRGFTVGIKDCIPPPGIGELVKKEIAEARMYIQQMDETVDNPLEDQRREGEIIVRLNKIREKIGKILSETPEMAGNAFYIMITSKSKGSLLNLAQVLGIVGQQTAWGARIPKTLSGGVRSLPHFKENEDSIESRGFVSHSYFEGLTPTEYFMHAMASREGVLNTAIDTPKIGDMRRDLMKLLEDLVVQYDGSVRDAKGKVIQEIYGDDGLNAAALRRVQYKGVEMFLPLDFQALAERLYHKYEQ